MKTFNLKKAAERSAYTYSMDKNSVVWKVAYASYLTGWGIARDKAVEVLKTQHAGIKGGTLISYDVAADVLDLEMEEYETF